MKRDREVSEECCQNDVQTRNPLDDRVPKLRISAWFKKGSGTVAGTAGHRPEVGRVLRTTEPDPFLKDDAFQSSSSLRGTVIAANLKRADFRQSIAPRCQLGGPASRASQASLFLMARHACKRNTQSTSHNSDVYCCSSARRLSGVSFVCHFRLPASRVDCSGYVMRECRSSALLLLLLVALLPSCTHVDAFTARKTRSERKPEAAGGPFSPDAVRRDTPRWKPTISETSHSRVTKVSGDSAPPDGNADDESSLKLT